jgi:hypothetical protein
MAFARVVQPLLMMMINLVKSTGSVSVLSVIKMKVMDFQEYLVHLLPPSL